VFDALIVKQLKEPLDLLARPLARSRVSADSLTLIGGFFGVSGAVAVAIDATLFGLVLLLLNRLFDGLDGAVARLHGPTDRGAYLDIVCDFLIYSAMPLAFAIRDSEDALAAAFLIFCFVGTGSSFLAFSIFAKAHGLSNQRFATKSFYYLEGFTEGFETILIFCLMCLFPSWFGLLAYGFGVLCLVTAVGRISYSAQTLDGISRVDPDSLR
jgi:phosphatidylglycerophosphate synthase|tara:strand:- start:6764 stop:7399 length:636 start_codon:yes stop_codon:yes gene_type:complete